MCASHIKNVDLRLKHDKGYLLCFIKERVVRLDEGVDLLSNSRLIAASIVANRNLNSLANKPSQPLHFSSPCRRRFDFPGSLYASPGCLFPISYPFLSC